MRRIIVLLLAAASLFLCASAAADTIYINRLPTLKPTAVPLATPTPTASPTAAPTPMATAVPTAVPEPTPTAAPVEQLPSFTPSPAPTVPPIPALAAAPGEEIFVNRITDPYAGAGFVFADESALLEIWIPSITEADCALIRCGGETLMIDCARSGQAKKLISLLDYAGVEQVDRVFISHPHPDHMGAFRDLLRAGRVKELVVCHAQRENNYSMRIWSAAAERAVPVTSVSGGEVLRVGGAELELWLINSPYSSLNERSGILRLSYGGFTVLFTGDLEAYGFRCLMAEMGPEWLQTDVLKYPHHGAQAIPDEVKTEMHPQLTIVTAPQNKRAGKVCAEEISETVAYTDQKMVHIITDGQIWIAEYVKQP